MVRRCVLARNTVNEEALARWGLLRQKQTNKQTNFQKLFRKKIVLSHSAFDHDEHYVGKQVRIIKYDMLKYHKKNCYLYTGEQVLFSIFLLTVCAILP
jgi:secreted Zn-dependent insulinase-like peptidase